MLDEPTIAARELGRLLATSGNPNLRVLLASEHILARPEGEEIIAGYREGVARRWYDQRRTHRLMNRALSQRRTPLADREFWRDLGLFEPHPLFLTEGASSWRTA